jgi:hypothetical protein
MNLIWFISKRPTGVAIEATPEKNKEQIEKMENFIEWIQPKAATPSEEEIQAIRKRFTGNLFVSARPSKPITFGN